MEQQSNKTIIKIDINDIDNFINVLLKEQENIYSIIDKEENTNYVEQYKDNNISILNFFDIIHFPQSTYIKFNNETSSVSYNNIIPFTIIQNEDIIYFIYNGIKEKNDDTDKFIKKFNDELSELNYDLTNLKKATTEQLSDIVANGKSAFIIKDEYYILNNI